MGQRDYGCPYNDRVHPEWRDLHSRASPVAPRAACGACSTPLTGAGTAPTTDLRLLRDWAQDRVRPDSAQVPGETLAHSGCPPRIGVALIWPVVSPAPRGERLSKGFAWLEVAVPSSPDNQRRDRERTGGRDHRDRSAQALGHDRGD